MRASPSRPASHAEVRGFVEATVREVGRMIARTPVHGVRSKGSLDLVSAIDEDAERLLLLRFGERFPDDAILAEESAPSASLADRMWVIDPLDGTINFVAGLPCYAVSVALLEFGTPSIACVYDPVRDELFSAELGVGAFCNGEPLRAQASAVSCFALSSGALAQLAERDPQALSAITRQWGKFRNLGSQALHLCYVAAGRLAAAASMEGKLWDNAAGALLVSEAGGTLTSFDRRALFPLRGDESCLRGDAMPSLAVANGATQDWLSMLGGLAR